MRSIKWTILISWAAVMLASPALAEEDTKDQARERERTEVSAEQRQKAREERRKAVHSLPEEQRAAVREAHRKAMAHERGENRKRKGEREHAPDRGAMGGRGKGKGKGKHSGHGEGR